jgi:23S rRNA pseudouridine2605 synthase
MKPTARRERIQKVLAAHGIGSRREVESWITAGRITVNGSAAQPGQPVGPRDDIRLDGRRLRIDWREETTVAALVYHRPAHERILEGAEDGARASLDRLPRPPGGRWIPLSPLGVGEGGLELFVNDGTLAASVMRGTDKLSSEFSVRVRGDFDESRVAELLEAAASDPECAGRLETVEPTGGEAANRWARVVAVGLRPRDLKRIFERCGLEANRVLRTRFGPVVMDRALSRGRSRRLTEGELAALRESVGLPAPRQPRGRKPASQRPAGAKVKGRTVPASRKRGR